MKLLTRLTLGYSLLLALAPVMCAENVARDQIVQRTFLACNKRLPLETS